MTITPEQLKVLLANIVPTGDPQEKCKDKEANTVQGGGALLRSGAKTKECCGRCLEGARSHACSKNRLSRHVTPLREAVQIDRDKREIRAAVITEGPGNQVDRNYYSRQAVEDLVHKLDGDQSYINHQTEAERKERGEGDVWGLGGHWKDATLETVNDAGIQKAACMATLQCDESEAGKEAFAKAVAAVEYRRQFPDSGKVYCGLSINKDGMQTGTVEANGQEYRGQGPAYANITAFAPGGSVDVVTKPARGGEFLRLVEAAKGGKDISKAEATEMKNLKEIIEKHLRESLKKTLEQKDDDTKTMKAKADLVDTAVTQAIANLPAAAEQAPAPDEKKPGAEEEPENKTDQEAHVGEIPPEMLEQLKKDIDMREGESEQDYMGRLGNAMKTMGGGTQEQAAPPVKDEKKGEESVKVLESFRQEDPKRFDSILAGFRLKLGEERKDFRGVREDNQQLRSQLRESQAKLMMVSDLQEGKQLLDDSDVQIPAEMLCEADMVGMSPEQKKREVEKYQAILIEGSRFVAGRPRTASGGSGAGGLNTDGLRIVRKERK